MVPVLAVAGAAVSGISTGEALTAVAAVAGATIKRNGAIHAAKWAFGAACAPWVGAVLTAGTLAYGGYKIAKLLTDKDKSGEFSAGVGANGAHVNLKVNK